MKKFDAKENTKSGKFVWAQVKGEKSKEDGKASKEGLVCGHCKLTGHVF